MGELITAIITTYHREFNYIKRAIRSIENQTYSDIEIVVVDDNQDGNVFSVALQKELKNYPEVRYIKQDGNKGACAARNLGIKDARGTYVAFLDDDDEWLPKKIEEQMWVFEQNQSVKLGLVFCNGYIVNEERPEGKTLYQPGMRNMCPTYMDMLYADYIGSTSQPLILKEAVVRAGYFDETLPARQDYDMWIRISREYEMIGIDKPLFLYYRHAGEQITSSGKKSLLGYLTIYYKYLKDYKTSPKAYQSIVEAVMRNAGKVDRKVWWLFRLKLKAYHMTHNRK